MLLIALNADRQASVNFSTAGEVMLDCYFLCFPPCTVFLAPVTCHYCVLLSFLSASLLQLLFFAWSCLSTALSCSCSCPTVCRRPPSCSVCAPASPSVSVPPTDVCFSPPAASLSLLVIAHFYLSSSTCCQPGTCFPAHCFILLLLLSTCLPSSTLLFPSCSTVTASSLVPVTAPFFPCCSWLLQPLLSSAHYLLSRFLQLLLLCCSCLLTLLSRCCW